MGKNILGIFDGGDIEEISALIDKLEKSSFDYIKLEGDGISIVIGKNGAGEFTSSVAAPADIVKTAHEKPVGTATKEAAPTDAKPSEKPVVWEQEGVVIVKSPNYGLFYAQSEPGAPPYVKIGDTVKTGDTVGLLETMKTFTAISSPSDGKVTAIHVKNEEVLEPDQPLISIKVNA